MTAYSHLSMPPEDMETFDMIQYSNDAKGRTNYIKFGRIWLPVGGERGRMKFFALPIANKEGDVIADMVLRVKKTEEK